MDLEPLIWSTLDDLFTHPSRGPSETGKGISLSANSSYGNTPIINVFRPSYVRQYFGRNGHPTHNPNIVFRLTYGTGCGIGSVGTPLR